MNERQENSVNIQDQRKRPEPSARQKRPAKGRYLKQTPPRPRGRRRRRRKLNPRFVILMATLLAMLIAIILGVRSCSKPTIVGRWDLDGTTVYEFGKDGKGSLILLNAEYEFSYEIEDDTVRINFVDEAALDAKYTFVLEKNLLFWTGGPGDARSEYVLKRIN